MFKTNNPSFNQKLHSVNYKKLNSALRGKPIDSRGKAFYEHFFKKRFLLHWGGLADPFCNFEKANNIGYKIVDVLAQESYPTLFSFKGSAIFRPHFRKLFEKHADQQNFAFQVSIVSPSDEMSRKVEIGVPVTSKRIQAIKMLSDMGYYTILRLRPFIIGVSDEGLDELLDQCKEAGIKAVSMEFFAMDARSNDALMKRYKWIGELIGIGQKDVMDYFKELSPSERGGYMRLNRLVKERFVKQVYEFCIENDVLFACSDPDYKELNMSGSCCGMPDDYPENREMENWSKNQLTYHLKELRRKYHETGHVYRVKFKKVFRPDIDTYLLEPVIAQDHPKVVDLTASQRSQCNYRDFALETWNNLRSPSNPANYFHGKLHPINLDDDDNYVYKYVPSEYEARWAKEGVDLKK
jgi:DNA repair photolyase